MRIVIDASHLEGAGPRARELFRDVVRHLLLRSRDLTFRLAGWPRGIDCATFLSPLPRSSAAWTVDPAMAPPREAPGSRSILFSPIGIPSPLARREPAHRCPVVGTCLDPRGAFRLTEPRENLWILTISRTRRASLIEDGGVDPSRVRWIPPGSGLPLGGRRASAPPLPSCPYIVAVSTPGRCGGLRRTIAAFRRCAREHTRPLKLLVLGKAAPFLRRLSEWRRREEDLEYLGELPPESRLAVLASARACIVCSGGDAAWFPVSEALHAAVPLVVPRDGVLQEIVGDAALHYSPHEPEDPAPQLRRCLGEPALARALAGRASDRAGVFSWDTYVLRLVDFFRDVLEESAGTPGKAAGSLQRDRRMRAG